MEREPRSLAWWRRTHDNTPRKFVTPPLVWTTAMTGGVLLILAAIAIYSLLYPMVSAYAALPTVYTFPAHTEDETSDFFDTRPLVVGADLVTVQWNVTGAPATCELTLLGTIEETWTPAALSPTLDCTSSGMVHLNKKAVNFLADQVANLTGGTDPTVQTKVLIVGR